MAFLDSYMSIVNVMKEKIKKNKWYFGAVSLWALSVAASGKISILTVAAAVLIVGFIGYEMAGDSND